jgi:hypothetical protein
MKYQKPRLIKIAKTEKPVTLNFAPAPSEGTKGIKPSCENRVSNNEQRNA